MADTAEAPDFIPNKPPAFIPKAAAPTFIPKKADAKAPAFIPKDTKPPVAPWTKAMVEDPAALVKEYPAEVGSQGREGLATINQGLQLMSKAEGPLAPVQAAGGAAMAVLGTMQAVFAPVTAAVTQFVSKPAESAMFAASVAATPLTGRDLFEGEADTKPWVVRHKDLERTEEGVAEFTDFVSQNVALLLVGGGKPEAKVGAAEEARQAYRDLVAKNAQGAAKLAELWKEVDPKLGERLQAEATKGMSADEQKKLGADIVGKDKPRVRIVGQTAEGKPKVRVVSPEQASAGLRNGAADANETLGPMASGETAEPWYYSQLERGLGESEVKSASPDSWKNIVRKLPGVKAEEVDTVGVHDWLDAMKEAGFNKIHKSDLQEFIAANGVRVETRILKDQRTKSPGGVPLHDPDNIVLSSDGPKWSSYRSIPGGSNYREILLKLPSMEGQFESRHWEGEGPVLAHIRMSDLPGMGGEKILGVHEIQSDWGQKGREIGFTPKGEKLTPEELFSPEGERPPHAPFVTSTQGWLNLSLKRLMTYAVENGYHQISFARGGQVQAAVGGDLKGQLKFYDEILPAAVKSLVKKFGGEIDEGFVVNITPTMRERLSQGAPLFQPIGKLFRDKVSQMWHDLYHKVPQIDGMIGQAFRADQDLSTHAVLDELIKGGGPLQDMLSHLRKFVDDVPIKLSNKPIVDSSGKAWTDAAGLYDPKTHTIHLRMGGGVRRYQTLVHEIIHAATARFMIAFPNHPLTLEIKSLRMDTFKRAQAFIRYAKRHDINLGEDTITYHWTGVEGHGAFYGISNIFEFVAEAPTNPRFQKFLATSNQFASRWEKLKEVVSKLGDTIAQMFGVKPADAKLLNNALSVTTRLIEKQAATNIQAILDRQAMASEEKAFKYSKLEKVPGMGVVIGKMAEYTEQAIRTFNPEALGKEAKEAASIIVKAVAEQMQKDSANTTHSLVRRKFWLRNMDNAEAFIDWYERGAKFKDPKFEEIGEYYKGWNERMAAQDKGTEFEYNEQDHYFAHLFKEGPAAINWLKQQTKKWGDPSFIKDRTFDLYSQARKAGFTPLFDNPEDIMLMRQHASDVAEMKVQTLRDMEAYGIAVKMTKEKHNAPNYPATQWRSPNGDWYWVHNNAYAVMHNAWNTKGLWELQGAAGDLFKGAMELKNRIVPIRLMGSLFHPLHVTSIDNATTMMRASKELLSGKINPLEWGRKMAEGVFYKDILTETFHTVNPFQARGGNRLLQVWQGKLRPEDLTNQDKQNIQYMFEGGLIPETAAQYRSHSIKSLKEAIAARSPTVLWHAPWAAIEATQGLLFQHWIPSLKIASYLKDVQTALKTDPKLIDDSRARGLAFRKLAMSVDNRYGEMPYNTLFWNKWVKDTAVASTLSLGWQLGFIREYGGGMLDIGQALREGGTLPEKAAKGMLDRPMFVLFYTAQALGYGGLMTYALSGKPPSEPIDYFFPKTGDKDANGKDSRVGTMFYTKEFYSIFKHIQAQGVGKGLEDTVIAKGSGLVGLVAESWTGMNSFGQEIRSEGSPAYKQVEETLLYVLGDIKPITAQSLARGTGTERSRVLAYSGFTPAPAYVTDTATEGRIKARFHNIYESKGTPFERAEFSREAAEAKKAYRAGDSGTASKLIDELIRKHDPQGTDPGLEARLIKSWEQAEAKGLSPTIKMFARMDAPDQKVLLDKMAPQEREVYLEHAKRSLRNSYEPPK